MLPADRAFFRGTKNKSLPYHISGMKQALKGLQLLLK